MKIGINIETKSAREQDLFLKEKYATDYYSDYFEFSLRRKINEIISRFSDNFSFSIQTETCFLKNGNCLNSIVFEITSEKNFIKKNLKIEIQNFLTNYFENKFKNSKNI